MQIEKSYILARILDRGGVNVFVCAVAACSREGRDRAGCVERARLFDNENELPYTDDTCIRSLSERSCDTSVERTNPMEQSASRTPIWRLAYLSFWVLLPLVLGIVLALLLVPVPKIGVIRFESVIWSGSISYLGDMLDRAVADRSIRAIVLEIDSPGGDVTATEELYFRLLGVREHKPLVVTVDYLAASGGYYMASAGDYVYAKPASLVGNIGVISFLPSTDEQRFADEDYVSTGPFKFSGGSRGDYMRQIELAKGTFLEAVFAQRADKMQVDREMLSSGEIFMGMQAVRLGLIDELGANSEAVLKAAELAHLRDYATVDVNTLVYGEEEEVIMWGSSGAVQEALSSRDPTWRQRLYYLYLAPEKRRP
jgi:protease-4